MSPSDEFNDIAGMSYTDCGECLHRDEWSPYDAMFYDLTNAADMFSSAVSANDYDQVAFLGHQLGTHKNILDEAIRTNKFSICGICRMDFWDRLDIEHMHTCASSIVRTNNYGRS